MQRRRQRAGAESSLAAVAREYSRVEALLKAKFVLHADAPREAQELGAASQEDVLTVVHLDTVYLKRSSAAAEQAAALEELDVFTGFFEIQRGREPRQPAPYDGYALDSQERTTT